MTTVRNRRNSAPVMTPPLMKGVVVTVDHVYLPVGPGENVVTGWPASNVSTSKVLRSTRLQVPAELAQFLSDRGQAEIVS